MSSSSSIINNYIKKEVTSVRWMLIIILMCNGIYFLWQNYLQNSQLAVTGPAAAMVAADERLSLLLLSEMSGGDVRDPVVPPSELKAKAAEAKIATSKAEGSSICWQIGPFKEVVSGKQVVARLAALDITLSLQAVEIQLKPDYWVHIPPLLSRKAATKLLRELQAKKVDSFLITEGELENGISLGIFTQQARAEKVFELRVREGYAIAIREVPRVETELWAVFDTGEYGKFSEALWDKIKQGNQGLERRKNYCDKIASKDDFD
jgi:hypothetical protein